MIRQPWSNCWVMDCYLRNGDGGWQVSPMRWDKGKLVGVRDEHRVYIALKASENVGTEVLEDG